MDWNAFGEFLKTFGFPIVVAIALGWYVFKQTNRIQDEAIAREAKSTEINTQREDKLMKFIFDFSAAMEKVVLTLENINGEIKSLREDVDDLKKAG